MQQVLVAAILLLCADVTLSEQAITWSIVIDGAWSILQFWPWAILVLTAIAVTNDFDYRGSTGAQLRRRNPHLYNRTRALYSLEALRSAGDALFQSIYVGCFIVLITVITFVSLADCIIFALAQSGAAGWYALCVGLAITAIVLMLVHCYCPRVFQVVLSEVALAIVALILIYYFVGTEIAAILLVMMLIVPGRLWLLAPGYTGILLLGTADWFCQKILDAEINPPVWAIDSLVSGWPIITLLFFVAVAIATITWFRHLAINLLDFGRATFVVVTAMTIVAFGSPIAMRATSLQDWAVSKLLVDTTPLPPTELLATIGIVAGMPGVVIGGIVWIVRALIPNKRDTYG